MLPISQLACNNCISLVRRIEQYPISTTAGTATCGAITTTSINYPLSPSIIPPEANPPAAVVASEGQPAGGSAARDYGREEYSASASLSVPQFSPGDRARPPTIPRQSDRRDDALAAVRDTRETHGRDQHAFATRNVNATGNVLATSRFLRDNEKYTEESRRDRCGTRVS